AGVQQAGFKTEVDLPAQTLNVDFDQVRRRVVRLIPNVLGNVGAARDSAPAGRQILEQSVFTRGQGEGAPRAWCPVAAGIATRLCASSRRGGRRRRARTRARSF